MSNLFNLLPGVIFAVLGFELSRIDFRSKLLPNRKVALLSGLLIFSELLVGLTSATLVEFKASLLIAIGYLLIFALLFVISRGQLGLGDVKFAFPCGLVVGWFAKAWWLETIFLMFGLAGIVSLVLLATKRINIKSHLAFGPYMFLAVLSVCTVTVLNG
mgnify:CR=1 FL=1